MGMEDYKLSDMRRVVGDLENAPAINSTVPTFNSCTESVGRPGIMNGRMPDCPPFFMVWMQE